MFREIQRRAHGNGEAYQKQELMISIEVLMRLEIHGEEQSINRRGGKTLLLLGIGRP